MKRVAQNEIIITGCFGNGTIDYCPHIRYYGFELGCGFKYGELPKEGFPDWCPLKEKE
jgi:hypothetical protein